MGAKFHPLAYATAVVVLVFVPQSRCRASRRGCSPRWVLPKIVSVLASMLVSMTVMPVLWSDWNLHDLIKSNAYTKLMRL